jgi:hypothetical protein
VLVHRYPAPVVDNGDGVVDVQRDIHLIAEAGERFVDRVVDDFVDEMVQTRRAGGSDVHGGPLAHRLEPLEDLDFVGAVVVAAAAVAIAGNARIAIERSFRASGRARLVILRFELRHE